MTEFIKLEELVGFKLPKLYREFLETKNGGMCKNNTISLSNGEEVICQNLYSFSSKDYLNVIFWNKELAGELPSECIIIGDDPGGGMFLLMKHYGEWKIMFWDHQYFFHGSSDEENTYIANIDLSNLLRLAGYDGGA